MTPLDSYIEHEDGIIWLGAYRSLLGLLPFDLKKKKRMDTWDRSGYELGDFTVWKPCDP